MKIEFVERKVLLAGRSTMRTWRKGYLQELLETGIDIQKAKNIAFDQGMLIDQKVDHNLVVTGGLLLLANLAIDAEETGLTYHAIGTESTVPDYGDTALGAEVSRKEWATREIYGSGISLSVYYLAAECAFSIKECGVFGGSSAGPTSGSGILFSRYLQSYDNSAGEVDITFDYDLTFDYCSAG
jgi:hypothetical protein